MSATVLAECVHVTSSVAGGSPVRAPAVARLPVPVPASLPRVPGGSEKLADHIAMASSLSPPE